MGRSITKHDKATIAVLQHILALPVPILLMHYSSCYCFDFELFQENETIQSVLRKCTKTSIKCAWPILHRHASAKKSLML